MVRTGENNEDNRNGENVKNGLVGVADRPNQTQHCICPNPYPYPSRSK